MRSTAAVETPGRTVADGRKLRFEHRR